MVNTADMKRLIIKIASEEGVDPAIALAIAEQESGFNPNARNKSNVEDSMGMFQINTKAHPDYKGGYNPEANTRYAVRLIKDLLKKSNGNIQQAMAAYNGGWGGKNSKQAQNYAKQAYGKIGKYASVSNNADKIAQNFNDVNTTLKGGVTGMAANLNIPNPDRPNYRDLFTTTVTDPTGQSAGKITAREEMALRNLAAPVQAPQDIRPMVQVGTNADGSPQLVTASQYNEMLNQLDTERILQTNQQLQSALPAMSRAEVQLGGQNAYDTLKGLRDEYNQAILNDPRMNLARLTPEQAREAASELRNEYMWGGNRNNLNRAQMYQMLNALDNYQTPYSDLYNLTGEGYVRQLDNMKEFQKAALTLAGGNQQLAQELMQQATAGNKQVIDALQKTQQARIDQETAIQKQMQSDYGTMLNTQRQGLNTYFNQLPITEQNAINAQNQFNLGRYGTDAGVYGTNVTTAKDLMMPQIKSDVEANSPVVQAQLQQNQQKIGIAQQNADTARAGAAGNIVANGMFNPEGFSTASQTVPSIRNVLGQPTADTSNALFNLTPQTGQTPQAFKFMDLFRTDN